MKRQTVPHTFLRYGWLVLTGLLSSQSLAESAIQQDAVKMTATADAQLEQSSASASAALAKKLGDYQSFQATFLQDVADSRGKQVQSSRGLLKARRPELFYWHTLPPMEQFIVADGKSVKVYDPDLEQVTIHPMNEQLATTPALLLSGKVADLNETYVVQERIRDTIADYELRPRAADSLFVSLRLRFEGSILREMRLQDSLDQRSVLTFSDIHVNLPLKDEDFKLAIPESVDIIHGQ